MTMAAIGIMRENKKGESDASTRQKDGYGKHSLYG